MTTLTETQDTRVELAMNGTTVHSLNDLRKYFNIEELLKYFFDGQLLTWLTQHYYETEASVIKKIRFDQPDCRQALCSALKINCPAPSTLSEEEAKELEERRKKVAEYSNNKEILSHPWSVAMNQEELAKAAAIANGYDNFHESHTPLATAFHKKLEGRKLIQKHYIHYNTSISAKYFKSKSECENAKKNCIQKAYREASNYISTGNSKSVSEEAADFYSKQIISVFADVRQKLEILCSLTGVSEQCRNLMKKIDKSRTNLKMEFEDELNSNADYYSMYQIDYFCDQVEVEKHDYRYSEGAFFRALEALLTDGIQYSITNMYSVISELENDLNSQISTFYNAALKIYSSYIAEIETYLDKIGADLPPIKEDESIEDYITRCCIDKTA